MNLAVHIWGSGEVSSQISTCLLQAHLPLFRCLTEHRPAPCPPLSLQFIFLQFLQPQGPWQWGRSLKMPGRLTCAPVKAHTQLLTSAPKQSHPPLGPSRCLKSLPCPSMNTPPDRLPVSESSAHLPGPADSPCSMLPKVVEEFMLRGGCLFWGTPGLGMAVLGEATQPGEGTAMEGDLSLLGEPVGERTLREELRTWGDLRGPDGLAEGKGTICEGV